MKNKFLIVLSSFLIMAVMTGCTKYASASPTPETPPQAAAPTLSFPSPTMVALEVEVATRTPIPLVLKTDTPTASLSEILTAPVPPGELNGTLTAPGLNDPTKAAAFLSTLMVGTPQNGLTMTAQSAYGYNLKTTPSAAASFPTRAPIVVLGGKPTVAIVHVNYAESITVNITNLNPGTVLKIRMGSPNVYGTDGPVVGMATADATGSVLNGTFKIPEQFIGYGQIDFRIEFPDGTPTTFFFYNNNY